MKRQAYAMMVVGALLIGVVALGGCVSGPDTSALEGSWTLAAFGGVSALEPVASDVTTVLTLADGTASGNGGVNSYSGTYEAKGSALEFSQFAATEMAGPEPAMTQEARFFAEMAKVRTWEINEGKLVLGDNGNNTLLVFAPK
ncbi:MAG: META domain-containing protein [Coriobacteriia bacterium]|nr:META domain-containing protein [Coriobacteriia bacterium]